MTASRSTIRLVDRVMDDGRHQVTVVWQGVGRAPREAVVEVDTGLHPEVLDKIRWYLEDYAEFPVAPAPVLADETERALDDLGRKLFTAVFGSGEVRDVWAQARVDGLGGVRFEIDADPTDAPGLPWELLREPETDQAVVLAADEFVRTHRRAALAPRLPDPVREPLRVLLVIARPAGRQDVPFRSVASRLVRIDADRLPGVEFDVLRPATFVRLREALRTARDSGRPYHVVHFDGHGVYLDVADLESGDEDGGSQDIPLSALQYSPSLVGTARPGRHGYLLFEPSVSWSGSRHQLVGGPTLAQLLVDMQVPVLVLNACRSAYSEPPSLPEPPGTAGLHDRVRAYGTLAAEVADMGLPGVVAMRYNVYVATAASFVADLYRSLLTGATLGRAATVARQTLSADPLRLIGPRPVALQDWVVPTVYEAVPLCLVEPGDGRPAPEGRHVHALGSVLPPPPDVGFIGRDETVLALDRAFDQHPIVLLHAFAGAGKTSTAADFARWYAASGGLGNGSGQQGKVVWSRFTRYRSESSLLDDVATTFAAELTADGTTWSGLADLRQRRAAVVDLLRRYPVLWIWDNVEPVAGFPDGTRSAWTGTEQADLVERLRDLSGIKGACVLLTSRRTEDRWLAGLPVRVALPPLPMRDRLELVHALVRHHRADTPPAERANVDWRPLLEFTAGNPLTIGVTVRQALRERVATTRDVAAFTDRVRSHQAPPEDADDVELGRDRSLAASLAYGFAEAFTDNDRARLALLHLFRESVSIEVLIALGDSDVVADDAQPVLRGVDPREVRQLLNRAVEIGLLSLGTAGRYEIHPALPWFLGSLFAQHHGGNEHRLVHAFVRAQGSVFRDLAAANDHGGGTEVQPLLAADEANTLQALAWAREHGLHFDAVSCLQVLYVLYLATGRATEWARLVDLVLDDYVDPATDRPLAGREGDYVIVTGYRIRIAETRRDWAAALRLQTIVTGWCQERAAPYRDLPPEELDEKAHHALRTLAVSQQDLGRLLLHVEDPACVEHLEAAYKLCRQVDDPFLASMQASTLGTVYMTLAAVRDLNKAQHWHERDLDLTPEDDHLNRGVTYGCLANLEWQRYLDAGRTAPPEDRRALLEAARDGHLHALELFPADHHTYRHIAHLQLGAIAAEQNETGEAQRHFQRAIHHAESQGDTHGAATARHRVALMFLNARRIDDALLFAQAALQTFRQVPGATTEVTETEELVRFLEELTTE